jgi:hypothetical protein
VVCNANFYSHHDLCDGAKWWRAIPCILDRPVPCRSDAGGQAAVADQPLHGWEVRPHDTIDQAAGDKRGRRGDGGGVGVAHAEPKGAEVRTITLSSTNCCVACMKIFQCFNAFWSEQLRCSPVWSFPITHENSVNFNSVFQHAWVSSVCQMQLMSFLMLFSG